MMRNCEDGSTANQRRMSFGTAVISPLKLRMRASNIEQSTDPAERQS